MQLTCIYEEVQVRFINGCYVYGVEENQSLGGHDSEDDDVYHTVSWGDKKAHRPRRDRVAINQNKCNNTPHYDHFRNPFSFQFPFKP